MKKIFIVCLIFLSVFSGAVLADADLCGATVDEVNFSGAVLSSANLSGSFAAYADFQDADLSFANLSGGDFSGASFRSARMYRCYAQRAVFTDADFSGADLSGTYARLAECAGADFSGAVMTGSLFPEENTIKQEQKGLGTAVGRGSGTSYNTSAFPGGSAILSGEQSANSGGEKFLPGDRVSHKIFGEGMVVSAKNMAGDTMLEVAFDKVGTKKLMANFARIKKI